jgi:hypothetical protein
MTTELAVDYSAGPPSGAALRAAGVKLAMRYVAPRHPGGTRRDKCLAPAERDDLLAHGVDIGIVFEDREGDALLGAERGTVNGRIAAAEAAAEGAPKGMTLYGAVDTDTTFTRVAPYLRAYNAAVAKGGYVGDVYGGYNVLAPAVEARVARHPWQTQAWLYGHPILPQAALFQHARTITVGGVDCDVNDILKPGYGGWKAALAAATRPHPKGPFVPHRVLRRGDRGWAVRRLQRALNAHGYPVAVDGDYGSETLAAVNAFKRKHGLKAPGVVGPLMWALLVLGRTR